MAKKKPVPFAKGDKPDAKDAPKAVGKMKGGKAVKDMKKGKGC